jgi:predicted secreted protein
MFGMTEYFKEGTEMLLVKKDRLEKIAEYLKSQGKDASFINAEIEKLNSNHIKGEKESGTGKNLTSSKHQIVCDRKKGDIHLYSYGKIGDKDFSGLKRT